MFIIFWCFACPKVSFQLEGWKLPYSSSMALPFSRKSWVISSDVKCSLTLTPCTTNMSKHCIFGNVTSCARKVRVMQHLEYGAMIPLCGCARYFFTSVFILKAMWLDPALLMSCKQHRMSLFDSNGKQSSRDGSTAISFPKSLGLLFCFTALKSMTRSLYQDKSSRY